MSARVDQRNKNQQSNHQTQVNSSGRRDDYDYNHAQLQQHQHPLPVQYPSMPISSPNGDNYLNNYYLSNMTYQTNFFPDANTWNSGSNTADAMSYLGSYGQQDYLQFSSGFDYTSSLGYSWPTSYGSSDYSWTNAPQMEAMKVDSQQLNMLGQQYSDYYQSTSNSLTIPKPSSVNGTDVISPSNEPIHSTSEIERGIQMISVNGSSTHPSQDSPNETSLPEAVHGNVNNSSSKVLSSSSSTSTTSNKPMSWANVASQPAKPCPKPQNVTKPQYHHQPPSKPTTNGVETNGWDKGGPKLQQPSHTPRNAWQAPRNHRISNGLSSATSGHKPVGESDSDPTLSKLKQVNTYNPKSFDLTAKDARFFVIKSYSEDDIHRAIKYGVWCSTEHGNKRLDAAFKERSGKGPIYLFYSVNGSGHFCGMAQMMSGVDYHTHAGVWTQDKWKGSMEIKWIYVKDVPNNQLRHIRLENNENKPVTNSRDTQEVPHEKGKQVLKIIHNYRHNTSIFDDFGHYEKKEIEEGGDNASKRKIASSVAKP